MENLKPQKTIDFAVAASAIKHTIRGDANIVSRGNIESLLESNFEIDR